MPQGVEHVSYLWTVYHDNILPKPLMPQDVEHFRGRLWEGRIELPKPLMPQGVEQEFEFTMSRNFQFNFKNLTPSVPASPDTVLFCTVSVE